jgi:hypothetical protein
MYKELLSAFIKGVGRSSGAILTMFVGWQVVKYTNKSNDLISFIFNLNEKKSIKDKIQLFEEHEEINLEDVLDETKFKNLFDKLLF